MSDVSAAEAEAPAVIREMDITITKGKATIHVNLDQLPDGVYMKALEEGLKVLLNKGMSKITTKDLEGEELEKAKSAAMEKAASNLADLYAGKVSGRTKKAKSGVPGVVMTEARRIAKAIIKDQAKAAGIRVGAVPAKQWTEAANQYLESDQGPAIIAQAQKNLAEREAAKSTTGLDIKSLIHEDPKLLAKAKARNKVADGQQSAKQASMVKGKAKGGEATAH